MKSPNNSLLAILMLASLMFPSCGNEPVLEYVPQIFEGADYLDNYETPPFLYQYEEYNLAAEENQGWIIDNEGYLRSYKNVHIRLFNTNNKAQMDAFLNKTEIVRSIDLIKLVENYKKNLSISTDSKAQKTQENDPNNLITQKYIGYTLSYPDVNGENSCASFRRAGYYARFILEASGHETMENEHTAAKAVLRYLKTLQAPKQEDN